VTHMTHRRSLRAVVLVNVLVASSLTAAQDPVLYTDNRATSSTFRDRGTSYAPTYLIYADKQRTSDEAKQLIAALGMSAHLDEFKARAFVVGPSNGTAYGPADLTAFQDLLRTRRSPNLKVIGVGAGATFVNSVISKYAFAVAGILSYGGTVEKGVTSSIPVPAYVHGSDGARRSSGRDARFRTRRSLPYQPPPASTCPAGLTIWCRHWCRQRDLKTKQEQIRSRLTISTIGPTARRSH